MLVENPRNLSSIINSVPSDVFQLCTSEEESFDEQVKQLCELGKLVDAKYENVHLHISSNPHDFGSYAGLEIEDEDFKRFPEIEDDIFSLAESIGMEI